MDNMSSNRRSKKIKPVNPEEQPQIKQFIANNSPKPSNCLPGSTKKEGDLLERTIPVTKKEFDSGSSGPAAFKIKRYGS